MTTAEASVLEAYFDALVRCDPAVATDLVLDLLESGASLSDIVDDVLTPAQMRVGELWQRGEWSVAQEHAATAVTEAAVSALWVMTSRRQLGGGPRVGIACAEGEWHALPPRMAAALAAEAGADVTVLGPSMPADQLRLRLEAGDLDVLALSCTVPAHLVGAARCVAAAHAAGLPAVVGGGAFGGRPERAAAIGADRLAVLPRTLAEPPPAVGADVVVPDEALRLDSPAGTTLDELLSRVVRASAQLDHLPARHRDRARDDLRWLIRSTGAAVLTGDPTLLDEALRALLRTVPAGIPDQSALLSAELVADGIELLAPYGASLLHDAVRRAGAQRW